MGLVTVMVQTVGLATGVGTGDGVGVGLGVGFGVGPGVVDVFGATGILATNKSVRFCPPQLEVKATN